MNFEKIWKGIGYVSESEWCINNNNPTMLSNEFNNHFATIGSKLASNVNTSDSDNYLRYLTNTDR